MHWLYIDPNPIIYKFILFVESLWTVVQNFAEAWSDPAEKGCELKAEKTLSWKNSINEEPQNLNSTSAMWVKSSNTGMISFV